jgi:hypothetical protein
VLQLPYGTVRDAGFLRQVALQAASGSRICLGGGQSGRDRNATNGMYSRAGHSGIAVVGPALLPLREGVRGQHRTIPTRAAR